MSADTTTSRSNSAFKKLLSLHTSQGIKQNRMFLACGEKLVRELYAESRDNIASWIRTPQLPDAPTGVASITLSNGLFNELNSLGAAGPMLALRLPDLPVFSPDAPWPSGCTLFIPFGDPENIGAVIRSAAGLGASRVVLLQEAASPFLPRAVRSSAGAILRVKIEHGPALSGLPFSIGKTPVFALDMRGRNISEIIWPPVFGLIAGMEGKGLPEEIRRKCESVSIPLQNGLESLNAAAAVSIALWTWKSKSRRKPGKGP